MSEEFNIELIKGIEYSSNGDTVEAVFIQINEPTARHMNFCAELKQAFYVATSDIKAQENSEPDKVEKIDNKVLASELLKMMYSSTKIEMNKIFYSARELLTSGVCLVDGDVKLTKPLYDSLSQDDVETLLGAYLVNFILRSVLS